MDFVQIWDEIHLIKSIPSEYDPFFRERPNEVAYNNALALLDYLSHPPSVVRALAMGGIVMFFYRMDKKAMGYVEVRNDGSVEVTTKVKKGNQYFWSTNEREFERIDYFIRKVLEGDGS